MDKEKLDNDIKDEKLTKSRIYNDKRRPSILICIILVILGALIASLIFFLCFKDKLFDNNIKDIKNDQTSEEKPVVNDVDINNEQVDLLETNLDINSNFVQELYKKVPVNYFSQAMYDHNLTTQADFTQRQKMLFILINMQQNKEYIEISSEGIIKRLEPQKIYDTSGNVISVLQKYEIADIERNYKSVFGSDREIDKVDYETNHGFIFEYDEQDNCFYGHSYAGGGGFGFVYRTVLDNVESNDNGTEIYLYDYYIKATGDDNNGYQIYTYSTNSNSIGIENDIPYDLKDMHIFDNIFYKYKENGLVKFKHTFKLDDTGNYYWYSCEALNSNE